MSCTAAIPRKSSAIPYDHFVARIALQVARFRYHTGRSVIDLGEDTTSSGAPVAFSAINTYAMISADHVAGNVADLCYYVPGFGENTFR